ncbi:MAG: LysR substrate-binding domain-containing protein [Gemmatimonadota bacterium]|jgi:DNA-binding transcriptional LysR family regulator
MELRHLRYFVAVAEELHFGRAAERLHVVQSAVSQQIKKLEREVGVELLARTKRRVSLTEAGRTFLDEARRTLDHADSAIRTARRAEAGQVGRLRVGFVDLSIYLGLPELLRRFRESCPDVDLIMTDMAHNDQEEALLHGELDIGCFASLEGNRELHSFEFASEPLVAALPGSHRAASRDTVSLADLREDPWVLFPRRWRTGYQKRVLEACAAEGFVPHVAQEAGPLHTLAALVGAGFGVALLPPSVPAPPDGHVVMRPLEGEAPLMPQHLVWGSRLSPTAARLLSIAEELRESGVRPRDSRSD